MGSADVSLRPHTGDTAAVLAAPESFESWQTQQLARVEQALSQWVRLDGPAQDAAAASGLVAAMRYAVLDGGKRLRPLLVLAAAQALGGHPQAALRAACAAELIHAYSLVHDDLPCMDNDVLRRGKPTVHVQFGQAQALLAGDALQALAFELLTPDAASVPPPLQAALCGLLARAAGAAGMAGGQAIDLASVGLQLTPAQLGQMHRLKTGALLQGSVQMGAACVGTPMAHQVQQAQQALADYGAAIGLAFQVVDDVLDVTADAQALGKTAGKDAAQGKPTYVSLLGLAAAQAYAQTLLAQALAALDVLEGCGFASAHLRTLAGKLVNRQS
ncbi:MAG: polyprenyl synthetase family protein [Burkholderiaceae bacterium]